MSANCPKCGRTFWDSASQGPKEACVICGEDVVADLGESEMPTLAPESTAGGEDDYQPFSDDFVKTRMTEAQEPPPSVVQPGPPPTRIGPAAGETVDVENEPTAPPTRLVPGPPGQKGQASPRPAAGMSPTVIPPGSGAPPAGTSSPPDGEAMQRTALIASQADARVAAEDAPTRMSGEDNPTAVLQGGGAEARRPVPARPSSSSAPESSSALPEDLTGRRLGGFVLKRKLGAGGMGAVYLARQVSLDRDVAVKILPSKFAGDPEYVARFVREALAAAQLNHHNVVQVFDVGEDQGVHYIAMEFVPGSDLGGMIRKDGKLSVEDAAGYVLQAARGLHYFHQRGLIHRDIKPDNLMVNEHGIVKIADMGLAKRTRVISPEERAERDNQPIGLAADGAEELLRKEAAHGHTGANVAMGTPAYMAPEQGRDASKVDHRADQYSLGCTLYYLCAGKTPFSGRTTFEILSKHASEPLIPIEQFVKNVPKELSYIVEKMLAKKPEERYADMGQVVDAIEAYLGVESAQGPYTPREHHVAILEREQAAFYGIKLRKLLPIVRAGLPIFCGLMFAAALLDGAFFTAAAALGLLVLTPIFHFILTGTLRREFAFRRLRSVFFGMTFKGWLVTAAWIAFIGVALYISGLLFPWIAVSLLALVLAGAYEFALVRPIRKKQEAHLNEVHEMLKQLRIRGVSEDALQDFICRFSGEHWEEFFERIFGYEDMVLQRAKAAQWEKVKRRKRYAVWRDPLVRWADDIEEARRERRDQAKMMKAEIARLRAAGMDKKVAEDEAKRMAETGTAAEAPTAIISAGKFTEDDRKRMETMAKDLRRSGRKRSMIGTGFRASRGIAGLVMIAGFAVLAAPATMELPPALRNIVGGWFRAQIGGPMIPEGFGLTYGVTCLLAGIALIISVFSSRIIAPGLALLGALALLLFGYVVPLVGDYRLAFLGSAVAVMLSLILLVGAKMRGKKL